jgi:hypothetical protein
MIEETLTVRTLEPFSEKHINQKIKYFEQFCTYKSHRYYYDKDVNKCYMLVIKGIKK